MGRYLKGKNGGSMIYVCASYDEGAEFPVRVCGCGLTFDTAMRYANSEVQDRLNRGWQIDTEYGDGRMYYIVLVNPLTDRWQEIKVQASALMY